MDIERISSLMEQLIIGLGEDPGREGLLKTPERAALAWQYLVSGYTKTPEEVINGAVFESESNNMIIVKDIEIYSLCEHHLLPFFGKAHIGYIAKDRVIGISKLARLADLYSRRLQIQERLTAQIARSVMDATEAEGVGVVTECKHLCMMMRGVEKQNSVMTCSSVLGSFHNDEATRLEFLNLINTGR